MAPAYRIVAARPDDVAALSAIGPRRDALARRPEMCLGPDYWSVDGTHSSRRWINVTSSGPNWFRMCASRVPKRTPDLER